MLRLTKSNLSYRMTHPAKCHEAKVYADSLTALIDGARDAIIVADAGTGVIVDANRQAEVLLKRSKNQIVGMHQSELHPPEDADYYREFFRSSVVSDGSAVTEAVVRASDGQDIPVEISSGVVNLPGGKTVLQGIFRDISERKRVETALAHAEADRDRLFDLSLDMLCVASFDGYFKQINPAWTRTLGWSEEELISKPWTEFIHPEDMNASVEAGEKLLVGEPVVNFENRYLCKDGSYRWISWNSRPLPSKGLIFAVCRDVTERKAMDRELDESRRMLQLVLDTIPDRVFWKDTNSVYLGCNRLFAEDAGVSSPDEMVGATDFDYAWVDQAELYRADDKQVMSTGVPKLNYEEPQTSPDGGTIWLHTSKLPLTDVDGRVVGLLGTYEDITEQKRAVMALQASEELFSKVFRSNPAMMSIQTFEDLHYVDINDAFVNTMGYSRDELIGQTIGDLEFCADHAVREAVLGQLHDGRVVHNVEGKLRTKLSELIDVLMSIEFIDIDGRCHLLTIINDVTKLKRAEDVIKLNEARLHALVRLNRMTEAPIQQLADFALEEGVKLTHSEYGYWAMLNDDETVLTMYAWSMAASQNCNVADKPTVYKVEETGLWGDTVRQRQPVVTNEYSGPVPGKRGLPEGHLPIRRHMGVPIMDGDKIVAVAGVANKETPYDDSDVRQLSLLMSGMWRIIDHRRSEDALRHAEETKKLFYRETIKSVTDGKLEVCDPFEVEPYLNSADMTRQISVPQDVSISRAAAKAYLIDKGGHLDRFDTFMLGVGEAITNALRHADGGELFCGTYEDGFWVAVRDHGPGIDSLILSKATLMRGFSTRPSLGLGYSVILDSADRVLLSTGPQGTVVVMLCSRKEQNVISLDSVPDLWSKVE